MERLGLAGELAARLSAVAPSTVDIIGVGLDIELRTDDEADGRVIIELTHFVPLLAEQDPLECAAAACLYAIDTAQDFIVEATATPWPGAHAMPNAAADLDGATLTLSFRHGDETVLQLEPLTIAAEWWKD